MTDSDWMKTAIALAARARGFTSPNPMVGAVVVNSGRIVGQGWHRAAGRPHAEVEAIDDAAELARGSDLFVTLEPCNHTGRTPPCTEKIIAAGIRRVVIGALDPNPYVSGGGVKRLRENGIQVETGLLRDEAEALIEDFIWYVSQGKKPFVVLKCAATLDGFLATRTGDSRWVTGEGARAHVHTLRHAMDAILVGINTVEADDPSLTARIPGVETRDPVRVILDSHLRVRPQAKLFNQASDARTVVVTSPNASREKQRVLEDRGAAVVRVGSNAGMLDLGETLQSLGEMGILSLLVEGGGTVIHSALTSNIVNKVLFFIAPKLLGGSDGTPVCRGRGPALMQDALRLKRVETRRFDDDILVQGYLKEPWDARP